MIAIERHIKCVLLTDNVNFWKLNMYFCKSSAPNLVKGAYPEFIYTSWWHHQSCCSHGDVNHMMSDMAWLNFTLQLFLWVHVIEQIKGRISMLYCKNFWIAEESCKNYTFFSYYPFKKYVESEGFFFFSLLSKRDVT